MIQTPALVLPCFNTNPTFPTMPKPKPKPNHSATKTSPAPSLPLDPFSQDETQAIRESMVEWYDNNKRDLPWRDNNSEEEERRAYRVWVSEVMLQQTRVQTVVGYYNRWMLKWPNIHCLSDASLEEVNELWAGLGYYRRARYLLEGAKMIVSEGGFPRTIHALRKVPGIGDYTAGAIASIAFNEVVPVVDGNVVRVLARVKAISANPKDSMTIKHFWKLADQLVDISRPGDFNQSLMELGATICTPLNPKCSACPISGQCHAFAISKRDTSVLVTDYPTKSVKARQRHDFSAVCVVEIMEGKETLQELHKSAFILVKRPDEGLLAGLWEFPSVLCDEEFDFTTRREMTNHFLKKSFKLNPERNCSIVSREDVGEFIHVFSHIRRKIYVELLVLHLKGGMDDLSRNLDNSSMCWKCVDSKDLLSMGLTSGVRKVYNMVRRYKKNKPSTESSDKSEDQEKSLSSKRHGNIQKVTDIPSDQELDPSPMKPTSWQVYSRRKPKVAADVAHE